MLDLVLENATVVTFHTAEPKTAKGPHRFVQESLSIGIKDGKIAEVASRELVGHKHQDLRGLTLLPGIIDSQVHFREPGLTYKEDLATGTRSAIAGGVTSVFEMPNTMPPTTTAAAHEQKLKLAAGRAWCNFAFYTGASPENISALVELEQQHYCPGIKVFMGSSTGTLLVEDDLTLVKILRNGRRRVIFHAEDEYRLRERKKIAIEGADPRFHSEWRDPETSRLAVERLLRLARQCLRPVHILHTTCKEEMELIGQNKDLASAEVLPQHLTLSAPECYERLGTLAQQNPPIREKIHQEALWHGVNHGIIDVIGSDHAPHTREEKAQKYPNTPSGMPGVQTLVPLMAHHVNQGKLTLQKWVELSCENPRWVFGCKSKGRIEVGCDADFTLIDFKKTQKIKNSWIESKTKWTPFDEMQVSAWPVGTMVGGHWVMRDGEILGTPTGKPISFSV